MDLKNDALIHSEMCVFTSKINQLLSQNRIPENIKTAFMKINALLNDNDLTEVQDYFSSSSFHEVRKIFLSNYYEKILVALIENFSVELSHTIASAGSECSLESVFLDGEASVAFLVLSKYISHNSDGYKLQKCVYLLEKLLTAGKLTNIMWNQCSLHSSHCLGYTANMRNIKEQWNVLNSYIASLPERIINKLQGEASNMFFPGPYVTLVSNSIQVCLERVHHCLSKEEDVSVMYISCLLGKLSISGYAENIWQILLPQIILEIEKDPLWRRISERLITSVPDLYLESAITPLIQNISWFGYMSYFLGHSILHNQKIKFLLTNKLLLLRYFTEVRLLQNILGYMYQSCSLKPVLIRTLLNLLSVWSDKSCLKHTAYEQHIYITKAIIVSAAFLTNKDLQDVKSDIMMQLMPGIQNHLDSSIPSVRRQGMIVAEIITSIINMQHEELKFEYEEDDEVKQLKSLLVIPVKPLEIEQLEKKVSEIELNNESDIKVKGIPLVSSPCDDKSGDNEQLDSDDDLEPFDMSNDKKIEKAKKPQYVRECMEGLLKSSDDPEKFEVCLQECEAMIRQHTTATKAVSVEFAKILLHVQDSFNLYNFGVLRHRGMVALLVVDSAAVAQYLTSQVYERNYNIRQRLDILEALAAAAKELSNPSSTHEKSKPTDTISSKNTLDEVYGRNSDESTVVNTEDWREVVQKRIDSKTRRFASGSQNRKQVVAEANRFSGLAGAFFFPLLAKFDRPDLTVDILGEDHILLGKLIYTLGVIAHASQNAPTCSPICAALLEFVWVLRYHQQPSIRQGLLFCVCMVLLSLPTFTLFGEMQSIITETKLWVQDVAEKDTDGECKKMAVQALLIIEKLLQQEFSISDPTR